MRSLSPLPTTRTVGHAKRVHVSQAQLGDAQAGPVQELGSHVANMHRVLVLIRSAFVGVVEQLARLVWVGTWGSALSARGAFKRPAASASVNPERCSHEEKVRMAAEWRASEERACPASGIVPAMRGYPSE